MEADTIIVSCAIIPVILLAISRIRCDGTTIISKSLFEATEDRSFDGNIFEERVKPGRKVLFFLFYQPSRIKSDKSGLQKRS